MRKDAFELSGEALPFPIRDIRDIRGSFLPVPNFAVRFCGSGFEASPRMGGGVF
jgi:hypothetical protein